MAYEAKVIADSICEGNRLTTMQLTHPRIVHSEFMTHCMFARNASSSRAIPVSKMIEKIEWDPFIPERFPVNQKGMQAQEWIEKGDSRYPQEVEDWLDLRNQALKYAVKKSDPKGSNLHKQIVNRPLEPWAWITVCVTGDPRAWENYFAQRCHPDAQYELKRQADMAQFLFYTHEPKELHPGEWHLPYVFEEEEICMDDVDWRKISVARCARTSYLSQEGKRDITEDLRMFDRLHDARPMHASPFEHPAEAIPQGGGIGKYRGWLSLRHQTPGAALASFTPNLLELMS